MILVSVWLQNVLPFKLISLHSDTGSIFTSAEDKKNGSLVMQFLLSFAAHSDPGRGVTHADCCRNSGAV